MKAFNVLLIFLSTFLVSCQNENNVQETKAAQVEANFVEGKNRIEVIDFYGTHRCSTCRNIEANTIYTLDIAFKEEMENGTLSFKTINFDDRKNDEIVTRYLAYGTSLYLNVIKDGKEEHIDLTEFAFKWGNEKVEYSMELEAKIKAELAKL